METVGPLRRKAPVSSAFAATFRRGRTTIYIGTSEYLSLPHTQENIPREGTTYGHKTKEVLSLALLLAAPVAPGRLWLYGSGQHIPCINAIAHERSGDRDTIYRGYELPG